MIFEAAGRAAHENSNLRGCICTWACVHMRSTCTCASLSKRTLRSTSVAVFHNLRMCLSLSKEAYASARIRTRTYVLCDCMQLQRMRAPRPHRHCQIRARWVHHAYVYGTASAGAALPTCCTSAWACPAATALLIDSTDRSTKAQARHRPTAYLQRAQVPVHGTPTSTAHDQQAHVNMFATAERLYIL